MLITRDKVIHKHQSNNNKFANKMYLVMNVLNFDVIPPLMFDV